MLLMIDNPPITLLDNAGQTQNSSDCGAEIIEIELDILGEPVHLRISAEQRQAKLADIVPMARKLSTRLSLLVLGKLRESGKHVPCCKGCSACCSYCLIPLSVPEAFRLTEEVMAMPAESGRAVMQSSLETARTMLAERPVEFDFNESAEMDCQAQISRLRRWCADIKLACPFLSEHLCTLYEQRPTACREHIVTGSPVKCEADAADEPQVVRMPVSILECLGQLTAELEQSEVEAVMLPLTLPWVQENIERGKRMWPAVGMVKSFAEIVKAKASEKSAAAIAQT